MWKIFGLCVLALILARAPSADAQGSELLRCEKESPGSGEDAANFKRNCADLKDFILIVVKQGANSIRICTEKETEEFAGLLGKVSRLRQTNRERVEEGLALMGSTNSPSPSLTSLVRGYSDMMVDYESGLANAALTVADGALEKKCLILADKIYRWTLRSFPGKVTEAARQRAQIGIDDVRALQK